MLAFETYKKTLGLVLAAALVFGSLSMPSKSHAAPIIFIVAAVVATVAVVDYVSCSVNIVWGCDSGGGGGGGGGGGVVQQPCTSAANACGQTNTGFKNGASCNATVPPNSSCPAPIIADGGFYANPAKVGPQQSSLLHWTASNATECTITGDNGFSYSGVGSGSVSTGTLAQTTTYTLTCLDGVGGSSASASIRVIIDPQFKEL